MDLEQLAREWTAVCVHSKHPSTGARRALDLTCSHGAAGKVYAFRPGECHAHLICPTCQHFERDFSPQAREDLEKALQLLAHAGIAPG